MPAVANPPAAPAAKKPSLTPENPLELLFFRPLAELVVRAFLPMPLSDVGLTLLGVGLGLAGASLFRFPIGTNVVVGAVLLVLYVLLNRAGGRLAKLRGTASRFGWIVSVLSDYVVAIGAIVPIAIHVDKVDKVDNGMTIAIAGTLSALFQGMVLDYFRNRYLVYANPETPNGNDLHETLEAIDALKKDKASPVTIGAHQLYALIRRAQEAIGGAFRQAPFMMPATAEGAADYAKRLEPIAWAWSALAPSMHIALLGVFAVTGGLSSYLWVRVSLGNALVVGLFFEHYRRERAHEAAIWGG